jgi:hypothetical protein
VVPDFGTRGCFEKVRHGMFGSGRALLALKGQPKVSVSIASTIRRGALRSGLGSGGGAQCAWCQVIPLPDQC